MCTACVHFSRIYDQGDKIHAHAHTLPVSPPVPIHLWCEHTREGGGPQPAVRTTTTHKTKGRKTSRGRCAIKERKEGKEEKKKCKGSLENQLSPSVRSCSSSSSFLGSCANKSSKREHPNRKESSRCGTPRQKGNLLLRCGRLRARKAAHHDQLQRVDLPPLLEGGLHIAGPLRVTRLHGEGAQVEAQREPPALVCEGGRRR